jgi:hypothetical protein
MIETGTITANGQKSNPIVGKKVYVDLTFAGVATVAVEWQLDGTNWRKIADKTASEQFVIDAGGIPVRLNCTAFTNNVTYALKVV